MKILVTVKRVPDPETVVKIAPDGVGRGLPGGGVPGELVAADGVTGGGDSAPVVGTGTT